MRVVLDTNILVRAAGDAEGLASRVLLGIAKPHTLICSPYILSEVARVLAYPRLRARWRLDDDQIAAFTARISVVAEIVRTSTVTPAVVTADPDDDPVVQTAIAGKADVLCTRDSHLFAPDVVQYCGARGIRVIGDIELYRILASGHF